MKKYSISQIIQLYNNGYSCVSIANTIGLSRSYVFKIILLNNEKGIAKRLAIQKANIESRSRDIIELYHTGISRADIARKMNLSIGQVAPIINAYLKTGNKINIPKKGQQGEQNASCKLLDIEIVDIYEKFIFGKIKISEIAKEYNCNVSHIRRILSGQSRAYLYSIFEKKLIEKKNDIITS